MFALLFMVASCMAVKPALSSVDASAENTWVSKASMQVARSGLGVAVVNGKIYAIGGRAENGVTNTNEEYDPATDTWTYKKPMPTPRERFGIAVYQNKIYCIGGCRDGGYFSNDSIIGVNEVYDPATDTWEAKEPIPTPRRGLGANVVNGKIYVIGGYIPHSSSLTGFSDLSINEVYDPETDSWTIKAKEPTAASSSISAVVDSKIYVLGEGLNQIYDANTDTWSLGTSSPLQPDVACAGAATGVNALKRIYRFAWGVTQVYDPETDSWMFGADMLTKRSGFSVAVVNDMFYAIGGYTATYSDSSDDWMFGPELSWCATNEQYTPFGYGTPDPSFDGVAPEFSVVSPENKNYYTADARLNFTDVALNYTADEPVFSVHYELDGGVPVEISGNTTIAGLAVGAHNVTVFGFDASGNMGASETVCFAVAELEPFPVVPVAAASAASVAVAVAGLLVYLRRRNHRAERLSRNLD
jgi:N-acetylneuraminic acid mutarotase